MFNDEQDRQIWPSDNDDRLADFIIVTTILGVFLAIIACLYWILK